MVVVVEVEVGLEVGKVWGSCCRVATPAGVALGVVAAAAGAAGPLRGLTGFAPSESGAGVSIVHFGVCCTIQATQCLLLSKSGAAVVVMMKGARAQ